MKKMNDDPAVRLFYNMKEILADGGSVRIQVTGRSMRPTFRHKVDEVVLSKSDNHKLAVGDVVLFDRGDQLCLHRIISRQGDKLIIRGDGNRIKAKECATVDDVLAVVVAGTMFGGRDFKVEDSAWRKNTERILKYFPLLAIWHRLCDICYRYKFSILVLLGLLYLSFFRTSPYSLPPVDNADKYIHVAMYFIVSLVYWAEWLHSHPFNSVTVKKGLICCMLFPITLGACIELGQEYLTSYRCGDIMDALANSIGSITATIVTIGVAIQVAKFNSHEKRF